MNKKKISNWFNFFLWMLMIATLGTYIIKDLRTIQDGRPLFILRNLNLTYDSKMEMKIGKLSYDYVMFIRNNTPDSAKILIPPQAYPWDQTGNIAYLRYFLYPRSLVNGNEKESKIDLKDVDYVLIDYGETDISQYGYTNVWPKFNVKGEYIIYWDPKTGNIQVDEKGTYKYLAGDNTEKWGLIKLIK